MGVTEYKAAQSSSASKFDEDKITEDTQTFTSFPKMPLEIRLKVWRASFKGREVDMNLWELWSGGPEFAVLNAPPRQHNT